MNFFPRSLVYFGAAVLGLLAAAPVPSFAQDYAALIAAPDRSEADRQTDQRRDPVKLLAFTGVKTGMAVLDMGAGGGYSTELMARAVGASGKVFAQDFEPSARAKERFEARMKTPAMKNVAPFERKFDDPLPVDIGPLDLITFVNNYHDFVNAPIDRAKLNRRLYDALKPGGRLVIVDHAALPGSGTSATRTLHRIDEAVVVAEVTQAGFVLDAEGAFLRHPADTRTVSSGDGAILTDKFALRFVKPAR